MMNFKFVSSLLITVGILSLFNLPTNAQNANNQEKNPFQSNEQNPLYGESGFNPMDLIHNANFFNSRTGADFADDTNKNIDTAASDFKKQQLQRLMQMQQQQDTLNNSKE
jgi:Tfp pilus assembly protein PilV